MSVLIELLVVLRSSASVLCPNHSEQALKTWFSKAQGQFPLSGRALNGALALFVYLSI